MKNTINMKYGEYGWVDFSNLPKLTRKLNNGFIDWDKCSNNKIPFKYKDVLGTLILIKYNRKDYNVELFYNNKNFIIDYSSLHKVKLGRLFIKTLDETHSNLVKYIADIEDSRKFSYASRHEIIWKCPNCGLEKKSAVGIIVQHGFSCQRCGDGVSYPNKFMYSALEQCNIPFETEKKFDWCNFEYEGEKRIGKYDFYFELKGKKHIIEMDGGFHYINHFVNSLEKIRFIDKSKDSLASLHNINLVRIDCKKSQIDYISNNIINSELSSILNFKNVNWNICNKYATSNYVKKVCDLWNSGIKSTKELVRLTKMSDETILRYLRRGTELKWCDYKNRGELTNIDIQKLWKTNKYSRKQISEILHLSVGTVGGHINKMLLTM